MPIRYNTYTPKFEEGEDSRVTSIKIITPLKEGYSSDGKLEDGMIYGEVYELEIVKYLNDIRPDDINTIRWEYTYSMSNGEILIGGFSGNNGRGEKVQFKINDLELLGKKITFYAYINGLKEHAAQLEVPIHYRYRYFNWEEVKKETFQRQSEPWRIDQGKTSLCGMASIFYLLVKRDSMGYMRLVEELHHTGKAIYNGYEIKPHPKSEEIMYNMDPKSGDYPTGMPLVDWLTLATLRSKESSVGGLLLYSGKDEVGKFDPLLAVNWPRMMERLCKEILGYKHVKSVGLKEILIQQKKRPWGAKLYDKYFDSDLEHLKDMDSAYQKGHEILMMIDSDMLYDKVSYSYSDILNRSHWIVYEGHLTTTDSNGKYVPDISKVAFLRFRVFTWGEDIDESRFLSLKDGLRVVSFKSTFYGYIECYNAEWEMRIRDIRDYDVETNTNTNLA